VHFYMLILTFVSGSMEQCICWSFHSYCYSYQNVTVVYSNAKTLSFSTGIGFILNFFLSGLSSSLRCFQREASIKASTSDAIFK
jgi:hypothetical protein